MSLVPLGSSGWDMPVVSYDKFAHRRPFESRDNFSTRPRHSLNRFTDNIFEMDDSDSNFITDIFRNSRNIFGQMDRMMGSMMPFGQDPFFHESPMNALMGAPRPTQRPEMRSPFAIMPFGGMNNMMSAMGNMSREGSCHSFSSSSVMTMTTGPDGRPQVYQATSSTRAAPGGVRETKKTESDSRTGVRKMAIGHHINERSHVIEKEAKDGEMEERQEFINLDESDARDFDSEFRRLSHNVYGQGALEHRPRHHRDASNPTGHRSTYLPALPSTTTYRRRARPMLALTSGTRCTEEEEISDSEDVIISEEKPKELRTEKLNFESNSSKKSRKRKTRFKSGSDEQEERASGDILCLEEKIVNGGKGISSKKKRKSYQ